MRGRNEGRQFFKNYYSVNGRLKHRFLGLYDYHVWLVREIDNAEIHVPLHKFGVDFLPCRRVDSGEVEF